ncbi:MAG: hydrogenase maturation nickel metallochaperone HypA [Peptococcaceae bacterium]|nr:hydrogenase maturation nickel metallochaperone HypA [Peptococcaceae bacterium]
MHELSLIQNLLELLFQSADENNISRVSLVKLVVGECHGALPDALDFAFGALTRGTVCEGAHLEIEASPAVFRCRQCGREFQAGTFPFLCTDCGAGGAELIRGRELYLDYYEGE